MSDTKTKHLLVDFGRRTYVFGLTWFTPELDEPAKKHAANLIKKSEGKFDLIGERKGNYPQCTVASTEEGLKSGTIAAASIIAEMVGSDDWLYVAKVKDAIWICHGRQGRIMPDGDMIYMDEATAREAFKELEPARRKFLSVPEAWRDALYNESGQTNVIESGVEVSSLQDIFRQPTKSAARLEPSSSLGAILKAGLAILLLSGLSFLAYQVFFSGDGGPTPEEIAEQTRILEEQAQNEKIRIYNELDQKKPWVTTPSAVSLIDACLENMKLMPLQPAGYQISNVECVSGNVMANYQRKDSYPSWLREWSQTNPDFQVNIDIETSDAAITKPFEPLPERGEEELVDYTTMAQFLNETKLLIQGNMTYSQPVVFKYDDYPDYVPLYGTSDLVIETKEPSQWRNALERLNGIEIATVKLNTETLTYTFEGRIYVGTR